MKLSVGDLVRVYDSPGIHKGRITEINGNTLKVCLNVSYPGEDIFVERWAQQCRKLKPKRKRREIWVNPLTINKPIATNLSPNGYALSCTYKLEQIPGWIKFREVKE